MSSINPFLPRISPHDPHAQAHHLAERIDTIVPRLVDDLIAEIASKNEPEFLIGVIGFVETLNRRFRLTVALIKSLPSSSERETHLTKISHLFSPEQYESLLNYPDSASLIQQMRASFTQQPPPDAPALKKWGEALIEELKKEFDLAEKEIGILRAGEDFNCKIESLFADGLPGEVLVGMMSQLESLAYDSLGNRAKFCNYAISFVLALGYIGSVDSATLTQGIMEQIFDLLDAKQKMELIEKLLALRPTDGTPDRFFTFPLICRYFNNSDGHWTYGPSVLKDLLPKMHIFEAVNSLHLINWPKECQWEMQSMLARFFQERLIPLFSFLPIRSEKYELVCAFITENILNSKIPGENARRFELLIPQLTLASAIYCISTLKSAWTADETGKFVTILTQIHPIQIVEFIHLLPWEQVPNEMKVPILQYLVYCAPASLLIHADRFHLDEHQKQFFTQSALFTLEQLKQTYKEPV